MVSSRDRSHSQRHLISLTPIAKTPPPAFLFPIHLSKTAIDLGRPHCLAPVGGGGGYLVTTPISVNRPFQLCDNSENPGFGRKNHRGLPWGFPRSP